ncbi:MAG: bifunctional phosphoribosylaminoimidazolecarboxamide formyltransferase/IMP cyclohydrolase [Gammaproteobacteria bacterium]|nr:bifunctional phosphoribosylaminoimidazolecarboxamide formyltransferase/IMP cyclohydrolase [Gammaproteobacteria bacterium]
MSGDGRLKIKNALVSVSDKTGLEKLVTCLDENKVSIFSTGGTAKFIESLGINVTKVSEITNFPEIMDGRVKTLNPLIYGGILNRIGIDDDIQKEYGMINLDLMVINLYPFEETISGNNVDEADAIENIDIGGPSMIRAAAKNFYNKAVLTDPEDYFWFINILNNDNCSVSERTRRKLAFKAFRKTAMYDSAIHDFLHEKSDIREWVLDEEFPEEYPSIEMPDEIPLGLKKISNLRYGENPHQQAGLYITHKQEGSLANAKIFQGKELSYNNFLDANTAMKCVMEFDDPACVIVKHVNPCGVATGTDLNHAYHKSFETDPESAFGGVIAFNRSVDNDLARNIIKNQFVEVLIAPDYTEDALDALKEKKNIRVISKKFAKKPNTSDWNDWTIQAIDGGFLVQQDDYWTIEKRDIEFEVTTDKEPTEEEFSDLLFAWKVCKYIKSNAIIFAKNQQTIGIGAGQMSRVNSAKIAALKAAAANLETRGSVMASDGFFPFSDSIEMASNNGISCIIQPGGSIKDNEVIEEANKQNIAMVFTHMRHFRH